MNSLKRRLERAEALTGMGAEPTFHILDLRGLGPVDAERPLAPGEIVPGIRVTVLDGAGLDPEALVQRARELVRRRLPEWDAAAERARLSRPQADGLPGAYPALPAGEAALAVEAAPTVCPRCGRTHGASQ